MTFWFLFGFIGLIVGICLLVISFKNNFKGEYIAMIAGLILTAAGVIALITVADTSINYNQFEISFELQQEVYHNIQENDNWYPDIYNVADVISANKELCDYQARRKMYGFLSIIPERVFDIEPIGLD